MKDKCLSEDQRLSSDTITTLPQSSIETILCLLPIEEAARTSILSREWRYKWTKIPKLVFNDSTVKVSTEEKEKERRCKLFYAIYQILLLRQSPIHEFTLMINACASWFEIDQIILHLATNHVVKKLTLDFDLDGYDLPLSIFSMHHLTDLCLTNCNLKHEPIVIEFGSLTSLSLKCVNISKKDFLHLLSNTPLLKSLRLLFHSESFGDDGYPNIVELFECIPAIEQLTAWGNLLWVLLEDLDPQEIHISLIHLKYLCIEDLRFSDGSGLTFLGVMMKCSPNLVKIKLQIYKYDHSAELATEEWEEYSVILEGYSDTCLEHLTELEIINFKNVNVELNLVKFILARSPNLKKVILLTCMRDKKKEFKMLKVLLRAPRASPVQIIVESLFDDSDQDSDEDSDDDSDDDD